MNRRHPLDKQMFLEGNRQKFVLLGLAITLLVLACNIMYRVDPAPYLQAVMLLIGSGVLGWSLDSAVKAYRVDSSHRTMDVTENEMITENQNVKSKYFDDPTIS